MRAQTFAFCCFIAVLFAACKPEQLNQSEPLPPSTDPRTLLTLPLDNADVRLELLRSTAPTNVTKAHFFDESNGIVLSNNSSLMTTKDKGITWQTAYELTSPCERFSDFQVIDKSIVAVLNTGNCSTNFPVVVKTALLKSDDKGANWRFTYSKDSSEIVNIAVDDNNRLFVNSIRNTIVGNVLERKTTLLKSTNLGQSWDSVRFSDGYKGALRFVKPYLIDATDLSEDEGKTWKTFYDVFPNITSEYITSGSFKNNLGLYLQTQNQSPPQTTQYFFYKSLDGGKNWEKNQTFSGRTRTTMLLSPSKWVLLGQAPQPYDNQAAAYFPNKGALRYTLDGGATWKEFFFKDMDMLKATYFYDDKNGYVFDNLNNMYKITLK